MLQLNMAIISLNPTPSILRGSRNSVALLTGKESNELDLLSNILHIWFWLEVLLLMCQIITIFEPLKILKEKSELITLNEYLNFLKKISINEIIKSNFMSQENYC